MEHAVSPKDLLADKDFSKGSVDHDKRASQQQVEEYLRCKLLGGQDGESSMRARRLLYGELADYPEELLAEVRKVLEERTEARWFDRCRHVVTEMDAYPGGGWVIFAIASKSAPDDLERMECREQALFLLGRWALYALGPLAQSKRASAAPRPRRQKFSDDQLRRAWEEDVLGGGPKRGRLKRLAIELGCDHSSISARIKKLNLEG